MTLFSHSDFTAPARPNKVTHRCCHCLQSTQGTQGGWISSAWCCVAAGLFYNIWQQLHDQLPIRFLPCVQWTDNIKTGCQTLHISVLYVYKKPSIYQQLCYKKPANFTFPFLQRQDRKFITFTQSGTEIKNTSISTCSSNSDNCNYSFLKIYGCEAYLQK